MKKYIALLISVILVVGLFAGCSKNTSKSGESQKSDKETVEGSNNKWPKTIKDGAGKEVTLDKKPERIVVLHSMFLEYFYALDTPPVASAGATEGGIAQVLEKSETLKGYDTSNIIDLGGAGEINLEAVLEAKPDVIVTFKGHIDKIYDELVKVAPVVQVDFSDTWQNQTKLCAEVVGDESSSDKLINETKEEIKKAKETLQNYKDKTFALLRVDGKGNFIALGSNGSNYYDNENGFGLTPPENYKEDVETFSLETLSQMNPDYIIFRHKEDIVNSTIDKYKDSEIWKSLNAVKNNNVLILDESLNSESPIASKLSAKKLIDAVSK